MSECRVKVDSASATHLSVCSCGWREYSSTRTGAWGLAKDHQQRAGVDPTYSNAGRTFDKRKQRGQ